MKRPSKRLLEVERLLCEADYRLFCVLRFGEPRDIEAAEEFLSLIREVVLRAFARTPTKRKAKRARGRK